MKLQKYWLLPIAVLLAGTAGSALAHGKRGSVGIYVGPGAFWGAPYYRPYYPRPYYYPEPYYAPSPVIITQPAPPPVYIEQSDAAPAAAPEATNYWHYCRESQSYYPYVKECAGAWQKVLPQPAN